MTLSHPFLLIVLLCESSPTVALYSRPFYFFGFLFTTQISLFFQVSTLRLIPSFTPLTGLKLTSPLTSLGLLQNIQHRKYARWKATYIHNCLKNGETPQAGPLVMEQDEEAGGTADMALGQTVVPELHQSASSVCVCGTVAGKR